MSTSGTATTTTAAARSRFSSSASSTSSPPLGSDGGRSAGRPPSGDGYCWRASTEAGLEVGQDRVQVGRVVDVVDDGVEERR